ncbi:MAG: transcription antitermination factor NusB [Clostridia bacterium]|nr:transcription antitermination factor NusB [Clostridia bacterium]
MDRTLARASAMKLIYEWEMGGDGGEDTRLGLLEIKPGESESDYMERLVAGVKENKAEIDERIARYLNGWSIDRVNRVELSIMRVAVFEMTKTDLSPAVAVNEALELTRTYSSPEDVAFVNGVLGSIARSL